MDGGGGAPPSHDDARWRDRAFGTAQVNVLPGQGDQNERELISFICLDITVHNVNLTTYSTSFTFGLSCPPTISCC